MSEIHSYKENTLIQRLELWTERLVKLAREQERCVFALADLGIIAQGAAPAVRPTDRPAVIRLKERLLQLKTLHRSIHEELTAAGAELLDEETMEFVVPGGPLPGSFLSWVPGEPQIAWWRKTNHLSTARRALPTGGEERHKPVLH